MGSAQAAVITILTGGQLRDLHIYHIYIPANQISSVRRVMVRIYVAILGTCIHIYYIYIIYMYTYVCAKDNEILAVHERLHKMIKAKGLLVAGICHIYTLSIHISLYNYNCQPIGPNTISLLAGGCTICVTQMILSPSFIFLHL